MLERRYAALRQESGRALSGTALTYGEVAVLPWGRERFEAGAFAGKLADVRLDVQHERSRIIARTGGGGLTLEDSAAALRLRAVLPETREAEDALRLVRSGVLRGLSVEFSAEAERRDGEVRVVERADLVAVSVVDTPAYRLSLVEPRRLGFLGTLRGSIPYGRRVACSCAGGGCDSAYFGTRSLDHLLEDFSERSEQRERRDVLAVSGSYQGAFASASSGSLRFRKTDAAMELEADVPDTEAGRRVAELVESVGVLARPYVRDAETVGRADGRTRIFEEPVEVGSIVVGPSDRIAGWSAARLTRRKRRRRWLYQ